MFTRFRSMSVALAAAFALVSVAVSTPAFADPPGRVVRLAYMGGDVSYQQAGDDGWTEASLNRPLIAGDGLYADRASRVEMEVGAASVRLDERSNFRVLNLDDSFAQMELTEGVMNLRVRRLFDGDTYEIDTPTLAFVIDRAGSFRVDIAPDGSSTMLTIFDGSGTVYGENNASYAVSGGRSYRFYDTSLRDYESFDLPRQDDFDRWCYERDGRYERSVSRRYVSEEVIGYADLDDYGSWSTVETYGSIWYPSRVDAGWAPYRQGRWMWVDPWGWTWVDRSPWGFAPFHYGRWAYVGSRWGWVPGPRHVRPVYAPALVAFVGGNNFGVSVNVGGPVGWFPLGPRDVYVPWYRGSRNYFNNINVRNTTIINNTYITNVYNDYSRGRPVNNFNYAYRNNERAFSAIPREDFVGARPVDRALLRVDRAQMGRGEVLSRVDVRPVAASFRGGDEVANRARLPSADIARRAVVARSEPARAPALQGRLREIERNGNQPLGVSQMREMAQQSPATAARNVERVRVVGTPGAAAARTAQPLPARDASDRGRAPVTQPGGAVDRDARIGRDETRTPNPAASRAAQGVEARPGIETRDRRVPSSDYAPARGAADRGERTSTPAVRAPSRNELEGRSDTRASQPSVRAPQRSETVAPRAPVERRDSVQPQQTTSPVERSQPSRVERSQPMRETPQPRSTPQRVERSAPVQRDAAPRIERSAPVQREASPRIERSAPVQREAPQRMERSAPVREAAPQRSAPQPAQRSAPQPQQRQQQAPERKSNDEGNDNERKRRND